MPKWSSLSVEDWKHLKTILQQRQALTRDGRSRANSVFKVMAPGQLKPRQCLGWKGLKMPRLRHWANETNFGLFLFVFGADQVSGGDGWHKAKGRKSVGKFHGRPLVLDVWMLDNSNPNGQQLQNREGLQPKFGPCMLLGVLWKMYRMSPDTKSAVSVSQAFDKFAAKEAVERVPLYHGCSARFLEARVKPRGGWQCWRPSESLQAVAPKLHSELVEAGNDIMVEGEIGAVDSDLGQWWIWHDMAWRFQTLVVTGFTVVDMCTPEWYDINKMARSPIAEWRDSRWFKMDMVVLAQWTYVEDIGSDDLGVPHCATTMRWLHVHPLPRRCRTDQGRRGRWEIRGQKFLKRIGHTFLQQTDSSADSLQFFWPQKAQRERESDNWMSQFFIPKSLWLWGSKMQKRVRVRVAMSAFLDSELPGRSCLWRVCINFKESSCTSSPKHHSSDLTTKSKIRSHSASLRSGILWQFWFLFWKIKRWEHCCLRVMHYSTLYIIIGYSNFLSTVTQSLQLIVDDVAKNWECYSHWDHWEKNSAEPLSWRLALGQFGRHPFVMSRRSIVTMSYRPWDDCNGYPTEVITCKTPALATRATLGNRNIKSSFSLYMFNKEPMQRRWSSSGLRRRSETFNHLSFSWDLSIQSLSFTFELLWSPGIESLQRGCPSEKSLVWTGRWSDNTVTDMDAIRGWVSEWSLTTVPETCKANLLEKRVEHHIEEMQRAGAMPAKKDSTELNKTRISCAKMLLNVFHILPYDVVLVHTCTVFAGALLNVAAQVNFDFRSGGKSDDAWLFQITRSQSQLELAFQHDVMHF